MTCACEVAFDLAEFAQLLPRDAVARESVEDAAQVCFGRGQFTALDVDARALEERAHVVWIRGQDAVENLRGRFVLLKLKERNRAIDLRHRAISFIKFGGAGEGVGGKRVLPIV